MNVEQVEIVQLRDLGHARGQRQIVWRIVEQGIARHFDFVIMNVRFLAAQPDGLGIGDEMNLVAALRQLQSQLRGYDAAAAVGGITGDADLHRLPVSSWLACVVRIVGRGCRLIRLESFRVVDELPGFAKGGVCAEVPIVDELRGVWMQGECGDFGAEGVALDVAMGAEASGNAVEVAVVVAGMAAEFERALGGHGVEDLVKGFGVEVAGGGDADSAAGGEDVGVADLQLLFEAGFEAAEEFDLETANAVAVAESEAPGLFEWVTNGADGAAFGDA